MADPVALYAIAEEVLYAVRDRLAEVLPAPLQFDRVHVVNGAPAFDWGEERLCGEHLVAWVELVGPTDAFPAPPARSILCTPPAQAVQIVVQSTRCEPMIGPDGFPEADVLDRAARLVLVDGHVAWNALVCWALTADHDVLMVSGTPIPAGGGVAGWETRLQVEVEACGPCLVDLVTGQDVPDLALPDGFLDGLT